MKTHIHNDIEINLDESKDEVVRVKAFVINDKNESIIISSNNGFQLPGGHVEENEKYTDTLIREIAEETGINIDDSNISAPFCEIIYNYTHKGRKMVSKVVFYIVYTNERINAKKQVLTKQEIANLFFAKYVGLKEIEKYIKNIIDNSKDNINVIIAKEMLEAYEELLIVLNIKTN